MIGCKKQKEQKRHLSLKCIQSYVKDEETRALLGATFGSQFSTFTHAPLDSLTPPPPPGAFSQGASFCKINLCVTRSAARSQSSDQKLVRLYVPIFCFPGDVWPAAVCRTAATSHRARTPCLHVWAQRRWMCQSERPLSDKLPALWKWRGSSSPTG